MRKIRTILQTTILLVTVFLCAVSSGYASQCAVDPANSGWIQSDPSTWITGVYTLGVHCADNGGQVYAFTATIQKGDPETMNYTPIVTLTLNSTPTDSNGDAYIVVPLIHIETGTPGIYIHLCPFDDIACQGESPSPSLSGSPGILNRVLTTPSSCLGTPGCCQVTVTINCCNPPIVMSYCTTSTEEACLAQNNNTDPCVTVTATFNQNGQCNYCDKICAPELITLASFEAKPGNNKVVLLWETGSEIDNAGFNIYRSDTESSGYVKINASLIPAKGSASQGASYAYVDASVQNRKTYYYKLEDVDLSGTSTMHGPVSAVPRLVRAMQK